VKIREVSVDVEKSISISYNSVRLRIGMVGEFEGSTPEQLELATVTLKQHIEGLLDKQILTSLQALPRLKKKAEELANDIPY
jgi:hypothetical protein